MGNQTIEDGGKVEPIEQCGSCRYCVHREGVGHYCHRRPPMVGSSGFSDWPVVGPKDWCGEYERAE